MTGRTRSFAARATAATSCLLAAACLLTGCVADYVDGSACEDVYQQIAPVLTDRLGVTPEHRNGNSYPRGAVIDPNVHVWCVISLDTGIDAVSDDPVRAAVREDLEGVVARQEAGAYVTITYGDETAKFRSEDQDSFLSPGTPGAR